MKPGQGIVELLDAAKAIADVRTLDGTGGGWRVLLQPDGRFFVELLPPAMHWRVEPGATPDEARAKAAAWVRSQRP